MRMRRSERAQWNPEELKLSSRNRLKLSLPGFEGSLRVEIPFFVLVGKKRESRTLIMAGVHGDEYEGVAVLHDLASEINPRNLEGTLTLLPVANPQALLAGTRRNPVDLGDLNRSFPGCPNGTLCERLAWTLFHELVLGNDHVMSIHGWSRESVVVPYVEYPAGNSVVCRRSYAAARALGLKFLHPYRWPKGVLGQATLPRGIATIEPEVGGMGTLSAEGQSVCRDMVFRLLQHLKMIDLGDALGSPPCTGPRTIDHVDLFASHAGLFRSRVSLEQVVETGEIVGTVHGLGGECLEELRAPRSGLVGVLRTFCSVHPGERLVQLFWETGRATAR